jgi:type IV pilus assembly protein PilE
MKKTARGFTLMELLIVVVIVAILAAIAIPSYQTYIGRANRSHAQAAVLRVAQWMERAATAQGRYPTQLAPGLEFVEGGAYTVCLVGGTLADGVTLPDPGPAVCAAGTLELTATQPSATYTVAVPDDGSAFTVVAYRNQSGRNARDKCGDFVVDNVGVRGLIDYDASVTDVTTCWGK